MDEQVPIGPMIYFGTFPIPLHQLNLTEEQMQILKGLRPPEVTEAPPIAGYQLCTFPEDTALLPDEE